MKTLIRNACVVTVNARRQVFDPGYVLIDGNCIAAAGPQAECPAMADVQRHIDAQGMVVVPGLINMHQHLHLHLLKGLADGLLLEPWIFKLTTPFREHIDAERLRLATCAGTVGMLRTGTTCVLNHSSNFATVDYGGIAVDVMAGLGMRQLLALPFECRTPKKPNHPRSALQEREHLASFMRADRPGSGDLLRFGLVIECNAHHTELGRSSDELVTVGCDLAREANMPVAAHMSGGTLSMSMGFTKYRRQTGRSDVEYLDKLGVLDHRWVLKHGIHFSDGDMDTVHRRGASVVYTPTSEAIRGGGFGPWKAMRRLGINCALGSDGPAVDYTVDMVEQMRACCYLQAIRYGDPGAISAHDALEMATINAARALGWEREIGSLEVGKQADLVMFDLSRPHQQLIDDPVERLVRTGRGTDAHTVLVNGQVRVAQGHVVAADPVDAMLARYVAAAAEAVSHADLGQRAEPAWLLHAKVV
jgi:5-methylthioadenosine/S-adenosylhomocysteine deaminase